MVSSPLAEKLMFLLLQHAAVPYLEILGIFHRYLLFHFIYLIIFERSMDFQGENKRPIRRIYD